MSEFEWINMFGDRLKSLLDDAWMSQKELAEATGLSETTISRYINKQQLPTVRAIINIAYELDCSIDDLVDFGETVTE